MQYISESLPKNNVRGGVNCGANSDSQMYTSCREAQLLKSRILFNKFWFVFHLKDTTHVAWDNSVILLRLF